MTKTYFRRADGVMLLYDVTSDRSFAAVRHWIQNIDVSIIVKKSCTVVTRIQCRNLLSSFLKKNVATGVAIVVIADIDKTILKHIFRNYQITKRIS